MPERLEKILAGCFHPKEGRPNLRKVSINPERAKQHIEKSHSNLRAMKLMFDQDLFDWTIICGYYAMYHAAKSLLALKETQPKTHRGVISEIQELYVKSNLLSQDLASSLSRGLQVRIQSDYDTMIEVSNEIAKDIIDDAREFLSEVERLSKA